jgi:hypothetical protein
MATRNARGTATEQQQWVYNAVTTFTAGHIYGIALDDLENGGTVSESATLPAGLASVADAAAYVITVMLASSKALFQGIAFSQDSPASGRINLKARIAGRPFNVNAYTATTGAWSAAQTVVRASSGPNDMKCAANYEENAVPVAADDIILHGSTTFLYNTYNAGVNFVNVDTSQSWSGRTTKITCGVTTLLRQRGPGELNIDLQATSPAVIIERTKANTNGSIATNIWGTAVASLLVNGDASVGFAAYGNVASTCPLITLNGATARLVVGKNVTATLGPHRERHGADQLRRHDAQHDHGQGADRRRHHLDQLESVRRAGRVQRHRHRR